MNKQHIIAKESSFPDILQLKAQENLDILETTKQG